MAQHPFGRQQSVLLIQNAPHIFIGRNQSLHQYVGFTVIDHFHRQAHAGHIASTCDEGEFGRIYLQRHTHALNLLGITYQCRIDDPHVDSCIDRLDRMSILRIGNNYSFLRRPLLRR